MCQYKNFLFKSCLLVLESPKTEQNCISHPTLKASSAINCYFLNKYLRFSLMNNGEKVLLSYMLT